MQSCGSTFFICPTYSHTYCTFAIADRMSRNEKSEENASQTE